MCFHELLSLRARILLWQPLSSRLLLLTVGCILQGMILCTGQTWDWTEYPEPNVTRPGGRTSLPPASAVWKALLLTGSLVSTVTAGALESFPQAVKFVSIVENSHFRCHASSYSTESMSLLRSELPKAIRLWWQSAGKELDLMNCVFNFCVLEDEFYFNYMYEYCFFPNRQPVLDRPRFQSNWNLSPEWCISLSGHIRRTRSAQSHRCTSTEGVGNDSVRVFVQPTISAISILLETTYCKQQIY